jgi:meso-butanediol dehydrogenase / (S,S)-butanediol dehydrogenase / diacetyl reductase
MKLHLKTAIVTGAGAGIGRGIAICLAVEGADVAIIDVNVQSAENVARELAAMGRRALPVVANVTDGQQVEGAVRRILDTFGKVDILVNNAGGEARYYNERSGQSYSEEKEWDDTIALNLKPPMLMTKAVAPYFVNQRSGKIINISSIGGRARSGMTGSAKGMAGEGSGYSPMTSYAVAKAGIIQFTRVMALQLAEYNINVNCICPGVLYTPMYERSVPRRIQATPGAEGLSPREYFDKFIMPTVPLGREQTPEDIGKMAVFLVSEDARNITGQSINVDGGMVPG